MEYAVFRACERFGIVPFTWEDAYNVEEKALLLGYSQIRELEEIESLNRLFS